METDLTGFKSDDPYRPRILPNGKVAARLTSFIVRGTRLTPALAEVVAQCEAQYLCEIPRGAGSTTVLPGWKVDLPALFGEKVGKKNCEDARATTSWPESGKMIIEIGSGMGDQAVHYAASHPKDRILGLEVWDEGRAQTMRKAQTLGGINNLRLAIVDAQLFFQALPDDSVDEVWTFFPDPWRKARHHRRRIVQADFAAQVFRVLRSGGCWRLATDWPDYAVHMEEVILKSSFGQGLQTAKVERFAKRVITRFERKGLNAGRPISDFCVYKRIENE